MKKNKLWLTVLCLTITLIACDKSDDKREPNLKSQVIVKLNSSEQLQDFISSSEAKNLKLIDSLKTEPVYLFEFKGDEELEQIKLNINGLNNLSITEYAEENSPYDLSAQEVDSVRWEVTKDENSMSSKAQFQSINLFPHGNIILGKT